MRSNVATSRCKRFRGGDVAYAGAVTAALDNAVLEVRIPSPSSPRRSACRSPSAAASRARSVEGETTAPGSER